MLAPLAAARPRLSVRGAMAGLTRATLVILVCATATLSAPSPRADIATGLASTSQSVAFSVMGWEVATLAGKLGTTVERRLSPLPAQEAARIRLVRDHFANVAEIRRLRAHRDNLFAAADRVGLDSVEPDLAAREVSFDASRAGVEEIVGAQVDAVLRDLGLRTTLFTFAADGWPIPYIRIVPEVFFAYRRLPLNLVVAPRDRIAIVGSVLVSPDLDTTAIGRLEQRVDRLGVASLVVGIGGFGSYPSMIPDTTGLRPGLDTVAHEWSHHYLAFRPLGRAFFSSYEMRTINETVADVVGEEVGRAVWSRYYASTEPAAPAAPTRPEAPPQVPPADFGTEMRRIRAEVERRLIAGDVASAEAYMNEQRAVMAGLGFQIRKLNTAYLSFFGAYAGGANRYEQPIRSLRQRSVSLAAFLHTVEQVATPEDLSRA